MAFYNLSLCCCQCRCFQWEQPLLVGLDTTAYFLENLAQGGLGRSLQILVLHWQVGENKKTNCVVSETKTQKTYTSVASF